MLDGQQAPSQRILRMACADLDAALLVSLVPYWLCAGILTLAQLFLRHNAVSHYSRVSRGPETFSALYLNPPYRSIVRASRLAAHQHSGHLADRTLNVVAEASQHIIGTVLPSLILRALIIRSVYGTSSSFPSTPTSSAPTPGATSTTSHGAQRVTTWPNHSQASGSNPSYPAAQIFSSEKKSTLKTAT